MPKTQRLSDAALVRRSQQGDRRAFGALVARYDRRLRGLAHAILLDPAQMDTALGLAYLRAWRDVVRIKPRDDVGPWLYRAAYNACIDQLRRNDAPGPAPQPATSSPPGGFRAALASLAPADRVAVVLVEREGFSVVSAARILGMSPEQLESRLAVARDRLAPFVPAAPPESDAGEADSVVAEQFAAVADDPAPVVDEPVDLVEPEPAVADVDPSVTAEPDADPSVAAVTAEPDAGPSVTAEPGAEAAAPTSDPGDPADPAAAAVASSDGHGGNGHGPPAPGTNGSTNGKSNGHGNRGRGRRARRRANAAAAAGSGGAAAASRAGPSATARDATIANADTGADTADTADGDDGDGTADGSAEPAGASSTTGEHRIADG